MQRKKLQVAIIAISSCVFAGIVSWALRENGSIPARACVTGIAGGFGAVVGVFISRRLDKS